MKNLIKNSMLALMTAFSFSCNLFGMQGNSSSNSASPLNNSIGKHATAYPIDTLGNFGKKAISINLNSQEMKYDRSAKGKIILTKYEEGDIFLAVANIDNKKYLVPFLKKPASHGENKYYCYLSGSMQKDETPRMNFKDNDIQEITAIPILAPLTNSFDYFAKKFGNYSKKPLGYHNFPENQVETKHRIYAGLLITAVSASIGVITYLIRKVIKKIKQKDKKKDSEIDNHTDLIEDDFVENTRK